MEERREGKTYTMDQLINPDGNDGRSELRTVRVTRVPGKPVEVALQEGMTVAQAIEKSQIGDISGFQVRCNGREVRMDDPVCANDTVMLLRPVRGN